MPCCNLQRRASLPVVAIASLILLAGCSSIANQGASTVSSSTFSSLPPKAGLGVVYIGRPHGFHTSIFALPIELDGKPLVSLSPNQFTRVELSPGPHQIVVPDTAWNRAISGIPHPANIQIEAGKVYYLLPNRWAGESRATINIIGNTVVPGRTADAHASFSVQASTPAAPPPPDFQRLTFVEATQSF